MARRAILVAASVSLAVVAAIVFIGDRGKSDLKRSDEQLAAELLAATPLGTSQPAVAAYLERRGLKYVSASMRSSVPRGDYPPGTIDGETFIQAVLGDYRVVFVTSVEAFYIFDGVGRLVDVQIRRTTDAL